MQWRTFAPSHSVGGSKSTRIFSSAPTYFESFSTSIFKVLTNGSCACGSDHLCLDLHFSPAHSFTLPPSKCFFPRSFPQALGLFRARCPPSPTFPSVELNLLAVCLVVCHQVTQQEDSVRTLSFETDGGGPNSRFKRQGSGTCLPVSASSPFALQREKVLCWFPGSSLSLSLSSYPRH